MLQKSQEMMLVYKKYNISPFGSCLLAFIQLPLFFAFLQAINRTPAIFEDTFLGLTLGQTPMVGLFEYHQWAYLIIIVLIILTTYLSFKNSMSTTQTGNQDMERQMQFMFKFYDYYDFCCVFIFINRYCFILDCDKWFCCPSKFIFKKNE